MKIDFKTLPRIERIGEYPLLNPSFNFNYRNPTNALHLYGYSGHVQIGDSTIKIEPGDITCIPHDTIYAFHSENPQKHWCVHFDIIETKGSLQLPLHLQSRNNSYAIKEQFQLISSLHNNHGNTKLAHSQKTEALFRLKALLLSLATISQTSNNSFTRKEHSISWDSVESWIQEHLHQNTTSATIAKVVNLSPNTFAQKFKKYKGITLSQYILKRRIEKAKGLLSTTNLTIGEIGNQVGIQDPQYFNKQFRKTTGTSPSQYREDNQEYLTKNSQEDAIIGGDWD